MILIFEINISYFFRNKVKITPFFFYHFSLTDITKRSVTSNFFDSVTKSVVLCKYGVKEKIQNVVDAIKEHLFLKDSGAVTALAEQREKEFVNTDEAMHCNLATK